MDRVNGANTIDIGGGRRGFRGKNNGLGIAGTEITAEWLTGIQESVMSVIEHAGLEPDALDHTLFAKGLRSGSLNWAPCGGTANDLTVAFTPVLDAILNGMPLRILPAYDNTGPAFLNGESIRRRDGSVLAQGDLMAMRPVSLTRYDGLWYLVGLSYGDVLAPLRNDAIFYVRLDGNNNNTGLVNSSAGAFATLAGAYAAIQRRYYPNGRSVTLQLGTAGAFGGGLIHNNWPGRIIIRGDPAAPNGYQLTATIINGGSDLEVTGCRPVSNGAGPGVSGLAGVTRLRSNLYDQAGYTGAMVDLRDGARCIFNDAHQVLGNGGRFMMAGTGATINLGESGNTAAFALSATPVYSQGFATAFDRGGISVINATFSGAATGLRFQVFLNGTINSQGGGINLFPGSVAGSVSSGGQYA